MFEMHQAGRRGGLKDWAGKEEFGPVMAELATGAGVELGAGQVGRQPLPDQRGVGQDAPDLVRRVTEDDFGVAREAELRLQRAVLAESQGSALA
jgi:hypothetical protein